MAMTQGATLSDAARMLDAHRPGVSAFSQPTAEFVLKQLHNAPDLTKDLHYNIADFIPGPVSATAVLHVETLRAGLTANA